MHPGMPSDEVTDAIALIEMQRQYRAKETGLAAACSEALRKLHELLAAAQPAAQPPGTGHLADTEAVMIEIMRVTKLAGSASQSAMSKRGRPGRQQPASHPRGPRNILRSKGRRTMGRRGDR